MKKYLLFEKEKYGAEYLKKEFDTLDEIMAEVDDIKTAIIAKPIGIKLIETEYIEKREGENNAE